MVHYIAGTITLWHGIILAGIGSIIAAITAEGLSGTLVAAGGIAIVAYGLWSAGRDKVVQGALRRESDADKRLDYALADLESCQTDRARLRVRIAELEAGNHEQA